MRFEQDKSSEKQKNSENQSRASNLFDWNDEEEQLSLDEKISDAPRVSPTTRPSKHKRDMSDPFSGSLNNFNEKLRLSMPKFDDLSHSSIKSAFQNIIQKSKNLEILKPTNSAPGPLDNVCQMHHVTQQISNIKKTIDFQKHDDSAVEMSRIISNQPYTFYQFQSLDQKEKLLISALSTCHTSCIIKVILFLKETLKHELFKILLEKYPEASFEYNNFLRSLGQLESLKIVYSKPTLDHLLYDYLQLISGKLSETTIENLERLYKKFCNYKTYSDYVHSIKKHIDILKLQLVRKEIDKTQENPQENLLPLELKYEKSLVSMVTRLTFEHMQRFTHIPTDFKKVFGLKDLQFEYILVKSCCKLNLYQTLNRFYLDKKSSNIFGGLAPSSATTFDNICYLLKENDAPDEIIAKYLDYVKDKTVQMFIAEDLRLYEFLVKICISHKNREKLEELYEKIGIIPEIKKQIFDALNNRNIKWK
ncbi:Spermatogenesis-defective protein 39 [Thelohanellus kitauei]|uniref:Spermatogenesis-defective protein 39 n=1 Tax=Thelohanellus kitauei TaxID=669202 RepID=A0A0C2IHD4_THEKT|nr:Spermatogenesis-defective protein 39 [Thelohanellus kitauei]